LEERNEKACGLLMTLSKTEALNNFHRGRLALHMEVLIFLDVNGNDWEGEISFLKTDDLKSFCSKVWGHIIRDV